MQKIATSQEEIEGSDPSAATIDRKPLLYSKWLCLCCGSAHNLFESRRHLFKNRPRTYCQSDKVSTQLQPKLSLCCWALAIHCWKTKSTWESFSKEITLVTRVKVDGRRACLFPPGWGPGKAGMDSPTPSRPVVLVSKWADLEETSCAPRYATALHHWTFPESSWIASQQRVRSRLGCTSRAQS